MDLILVSQGAQHQPLLQHQNQLAAAANTMGSLLATVNQPTINGQHWLEPIKFAEGNLAKMMLALELAAGSPKVAKTQ